MKPTKTGDRMQQLFNPAYAEDQAATPEDQEVNNLPAVADDKTPARKAHDKAVQEQKATTETAVSDEKSVKDESAGLPIEEMFDEPQLGEEEDQTEDTTPDDEDDSEDNSSTTYLDVDDSDLIQVVVDGVKQDVTLSELKNAYSGEGAVQKRLKEATEARKAATTDRASVAEEAEKIQAGFVTVMRQFEQHFLSPTVQKPNPELKKTNPQAYIAQYDAHEQEAQAIQEAKNALGQHFKSFQEQVTEFRRTRQREEAETLKQLVPEVRQKDTRKVFFNDVMSAARRYGFTDDEVGNLADHRYFLMARDAELYHSLQNGTKMEAVKAGATSAKKPRTLRSGNSQVRDRSQKAAQKQKEALQRAKATGSRDDIIASMIVPQTTAKRRKSG